MVFDPIDEISNSNAHKIIREIATGEDIEGDDAGVVAAIIGGMSAVGT